MEQIFSKLFQHQGKDQLMRTRMQERRKTIKIKTIGDICVTVPLDSLRWS